MTSKEFAKMDRIVRKGMIALLWQYYRRERANGGLTKREQRDCKLARYIYRMTKAKL